MVNAMPSNQIAESTTPSDAPEGNEPGRRWPQPMAWVLLICTGVLFWPLTRWVVEASVERDQIRQGAVLLLAAAGLVVWQHRGDLRFATEIGNRALLLLGGAFLCAGLAGVLHIGWFMLPAVTLGLAGSLQLIFAEEGYRFLRPLVGGALGLVLIVIAFPLLDWPLRQLAGVEAARVLAALGLTPQLALTGTAAEPQLLLNTGKQTFLVATECNGFGLITSGALLGLLAGGICGRRGWVLPLLVVAGLLAGFVFNLLRILIITQLAPFMPGHYHTMHEIVGTLMLWAGLGFVGWLAWRPKPAAPPAGESVTH